MQSRATRPASCHSNTPRSIFASINTSKIQKPPNFTIIAANIETAQNKPNHQIRNRMWITMWITFP